MRKILFLFLMLTAVLIEPGFAVQTTDRLMLRLATLEPDVDPELLKISADILSKRFSEQELGDVEIQIAGKNQLVIYADSDQIGDILLLVFKRGLLEFVDFSGLNELIPEVGDCILTTEQIARISSNPVCAPAEGDSEPQTAKPRQDGTPYQTVMTGNGLEEVQAVPASGGGNQWAISFTLNEEASDIFADFTGSHIGQPMAIILDGLVISAPIIQAQIRDSGQITGNFTQAEAENLAIVLRFGMLPVSFVVVDVLQ